MAQSDGGVSGRRGAGIARARLASARWILLAAGAGIAAVTVAAGGSWWVALAAIAAVIVTAILAPRRMPARLDGDASMGGGPRQMEDLSALALSDAVPDPIIVFDANGSVLHANPAALAAFGHMRQGTLLQLRFRAPEMQQLIDKVRKDKQADTIDYAERVPVERTFKVAAMPIGRQSDLSVILFKDQSETRRIDRMRADFIANASHELRTPLASISGFIETLRGPARDDAKARDRFLQIMQDQTARMARLIDDLLSLSRIEMKPHARSESRIDLVALVADVVNSLDHLARESNLAIAFERPAEPALVPGNRDELIQVFENLLENACKYGQSGGRIDISMAHTQGAGPEISVTIRDYGPGIAAEHIPRITERFYRVDVETSRSQKGTGLGLAIVKHILTRHDGRLTVKSTLGEGAAFIVHLPAQ